MDKLIAFLKSEFPDGIQMYNIGNWGGDEMDLIYEDGDITVDYAPDYEYIEVFGLSEKDFKTLNSVINA